MDPATAPKCRFCGVVIRSGDDVDQSGTAHTACAEAERAIPSDDVERWRLLRQLWKLAKS